MRDDIAKLAALIAHELFTSGLTERQADRLVMEFDGRVSAISWTQRAVSNCIERILRKHGHRTQSE